MKQGILLLMALGFFALDSRAQIAYKDGDMFVVECEGMPAHSYTKTPKPRTTTGTNTTMGPNTEDNLGSAINNEKMAYKFEVAAADNSTLSNWLNAVRLCASLAGGNWRLPTQREFHLIWIMHEKLKSLSGFTSLFEGDALYWTSTEVNTNYCWYLRTYEVYVGHDYRTKNFRFRCIRDF